MIALVALVTILPVSELALSFLNTHPHHADSAAPAAEAALRERRAGRTANDRRGADDSVVAGARQGARRCARGAGARQRRRQPAVCAAGRSSRRRRGDAAVRSRSHRRWPSSSSPRSTRDTAPIGFTCCNRRRTWNPSEGLWMGWERKRGKLHEFNRLLRGARTRPSTCLSATASICRACATSSRSTRTRICRWMRDGASSARSRTR